MTAKMLAKVADEPTISILPGAVPPVTELISTPQADVGWAILLSNRVSRPAPKSLVASAVGRTAYDISVNEADGFWIVAYQGQPINVVRTNRYTGQKIYFRTGFSHPAHCIRLVDRLNRLFNTTDFTIEKLA